MRSVICTYSSILHVCQKIVVGEQSLECFKTVLIHIGFILSDMLCNGLWNLYSNIEHETQTLPVTKIAEFSNSVDLDEVAHHEPPHQDLHCLPSSLWILNMI